MNELLKAKANAICAIEVDLLTNLTHEVVSEMVGYSVKVVRDLKASLSCVCISSNPTLILQAPSGGLFVRNTIADDNNIVTGFNLTGNPRKAQKFSKDWALKNAKAFQNGEGSFTAVNEYVASEKVLASEIESVCTMVDALIANEKLDLNSYEQIQGNYMGEFYKVNNEVLKQSE